MKKPLHRAWLVLLGCCLLNCGVAGLINACGLFYAPVAAQLGLTIAQISSARTVQSLCSAAFLLLFANRVLNWDYRKGVLIACLVHGVGYLAMGLCTKLWQFYLIYSLTGCSLAILQSLVVSTALNAWFVKSRGTAFSISAAASGISGIGLSAVTGQILAHYGWRWGYCFFGVTALALTLTAVLVFIRPDPQSMGMTPYGAGEDSPSPRAGGKADLKKILQTPAFYAMLVFYGVFHFCTTATVHTANFASGRGFAIQVAAYISSLGLAGNTLGKLYVGFLRDRIGTRKAACIAVGSVILGFALLVFSRGYVTLLTGVFLVGGAMALPTVIAPVLTGDWFTGADYPRAITILSTAGALVGAAGNWIFGLSFDMTGDYVLIFSVCAGLMALTLALLLCMKSSREGAKQ